MVISVHGGVKAAMAHIHLKGYEHCWRGKGWHGGGSRQGYC